MSEKPSDGFFHVGDVVAVHDGNNIVWCTVVDIEGHMITWLSNFGIQKLNYFGPMNRPYWAMKIIRRDDEGITHVF